MDWVLSLKKPFQNVADKHGIHLAFDTHYDAFNYEFSVVKGREVHRVDFQPNLERNFVVTACRDRYPLLPRFLRFLHNVVPYFPHLADTTFERLGELSASLSEEQLESEISRYLGLAI